MIPRVTHGAKDRAFIARAHGELVAVELAQRNGTSRLQLGDDRGVKGAEIAFQYFAAGGGLPILGDEQIFVGNRDAGQGACLALADQGIGGVGLGQGQGGVLLHKGIKLFLAGAIVQGLLGQLAGTDSFVVQSLAQRCDCREFRGKRHGFALFDDRGHQKQAILLGGGVAHHGLAACLLCRRGMLCPRASED